MKDISITTSDIRRAAGEGVISHDDSENLIRWAVEQDQVSGAPQTRQTEHDKGFNLVTVAYYFGAMLMITACGWFLGDKWDELGSPGILVTTLIYLAVYLSLGLWIRQKGFLIGGGLLVTVAVCLVPLIVYSIEDMLGLWPAADPGAYEEFYPRVHGSWIVMEIATILAATVALYFVRFGFLTAPIAFSFWFLSMDVAALLLGKELDGNSRAWVSVAVGLFILLIGYILDRTKDKPRLEDFGFWCYLFGLMAFWGGLTSMDSGSEIGKAFYALLNIGLIGVALWLRRTVFLVFGALGVHIYVGHLAYRVFEDSFLFPFILAFLGLSLIIVTVLAQWYLSRRSQVSPSD